MPRISLISIFLLCAYFAACCLTYLSPSLWAGWLIVIATSIWMAISIVRAFQTRDHFTLGFSVTACVWLITWLGFGIDAPQPTTNINWPWKMAKVINYERDLSVLPRLNERGVHSHLHTLYSTQPMTEGDARHVAIVFNAIRLGICLSALAVGVVGGAVFRLVNWNCHRSALRRANPA